MLDRSLETLDGARLREHQWRRFRALLDELYGTPGNAFWRAKWAAAGVSAPSDLATWDDFGRLPLSQKTDFVADQDAHPPFGTNLTYPLDRYVRVHQTSGTTGTPLRWLDTEASWAWWAHCWRFVFAGAGLGAGDRLYFPFSFGLFIGFWAGFEGARALSKPAQNPTKSPNENGKNTRCPGPTPAPRHTAPQHRSHHSQDSAVSSQRSGAPDVPEVWCTRT